MKLSAHKTKIVCTIGPASRSVGTKCSKDALFVFEKDEIIGILTFSDVFEKTSQVMKECSGKVLGYREAPPSE